jgi:hypothetical protein
LGLYSRTGECEEQKHTCVLPKEPGNAPVGSGKEHVVKCTGKSACLTAGAIEPREISSCEQGLPASWKFFEQRALNRHHLPSKEILRSAM